MTRERFVFIFFMVVIVLGSLVVLATQSDDPHYPPATGAPRTPKTNHHEVAARSRKMAVLVPAIEALAADTGRDPVEIAEQLTTDEWAIVARKHDVNPPSPTSIELIVQALRARKAAA